MTGTIILYQKKKKSFRYKSKDHRTNIINSFIKREGYYDIIPNEAEFERPEAIYSNKNHWAAS